MTLSLLAAPGLILGGVLITSGVLKLRTPAGLDEFASLGVPKLLQRQWIARLHPWGELLLGIVLLVLGGVLGTLAAVAAMILLGAYLVLVIRAKRATPDASCACFGSTRRITASTIVRNAWFTLLAVIAAVAAWTLPLLGGPLAALDGEAWGWLAAGLAGAGTVVLIMWPDYTDAVPAAVAAAAPIPEANSAAQGEELDYLRARTPAVPVMLADGTEQTLRELSSRRPLLLLAVSPTCGSCISTIESRERWRELLPEVDIRLLLTVAHDASELIDAEHPMSVHDAKRRVAPSLGYQSTPSAMLFGMDGMLAGGPVSGEGEIKSFVGDIYESLHGEQPAL